MKKIFRFFALAAVAGNLTLTSCIEETVPTSTIIDESLKSSSKASEALVWAMAGYLNHYATYSDEMAYDWGYGSLMHIRDVMTADMAVYSSTYNWYSSWSQNQYLGRRYVNAYFPWAYYCKAIGACNGAIGALKGVTEGQAAGYLGAAYAYRALYYMDAALMYEYMPDDYFGADYLTPEGNSVNYLTMPISTEETTEDQVRFNPRATHEQMYEFLLGDLEKAETLVPEYSRASKVMPDLACVYGLKARLYLWNASYLEETGTGDAQAEYKLAEEAARAAIDLGVNTPLTADEWLDTKTGFNSMGASSWMWSSHATADDDVVKDEGMNWTSWMAMEGTFGYCAAGNDKAPFVMIASALYDKMSDDDFRKLSFIAPAGSPLAGKESLIISDPGNKDYRRSLFPDYTTIKFRPGSGDVGDPKTACSCDYPLMRIEEMYLIEAEAAAHQDASRGAQLVEQFVQTYRYDNYRCKASDTEGVVDEIFLQKRIELWGEGRIFYDYKRLAKPVDRTTSSNWPDAENFKTEGRPAWMNFCITNNEDASNEALKDYANPDPSDVYVPVKK